MIHVRLRHVKEPCLKMTRYDTPSLKKTNNENTIRSFLRTLLLPPYPSKAQELDRGNDRKKRKKTSAGNERTGGGDRIEGIEIIPFQYITRRRTAQRWIGNGESASAIAIVGRAQLQLTYSSANMPGSVPFGLMSAQRG